MTCDPAVTSRIMKAVRNTDTEPWMLLRCELDRRGLHYRAHRKHLGHCGVVFQSSRVSVFVDGDYWHGVESLKAYLAGRPNGEFWTKEIRANVERDKGASRALSPPGWMVIRMSESDLIADLMASAAQVERQVRKHRKSAVKTGRRA